MDREDNMYGYYLLGFRCEDLSGLSDQNLGGKIEGLPGYRKAASVGSDFQVMVDGDTAFARMPLAIDVLVGLEEADDDLPALRHNPTVKLVLKVSVDRSREKRLTCGTWSDGQVGVRITNDPAKDDRERMQIVVRAPSLKAARQAARDTLEGKRKLDVTWII